jgi:uncharacterized membrane protein YidH (DUF202 family)
MGKALAFFLACVDLAALFALAEFRHQNLADELAMLMSVVGMALLAWGVAVATAVNRAMRGEGWRPVAALLLFLWLPAAPALVYGATGVRDLFARGAKSGKPRAGAVVRPKARGGATA